jgi:Putative amidase domain
VFASLFFVLTVQADPPRSSIYSANAAVAYAAEWALKTNPNYPNFSLPNLGGDCTNFVSQVLRTGGWELTKTRSETAVTSWFVAYDKPTKVFTKSQTWSVANGLHQRLVKDRQELNTRILPSINSLKVGDVVFMVNKATGLAHHAMVVTKVGIFWSWFSALGFSDAYVSYHNDSTNAPQLNTSLREIVAKSMKTDDFSFVAISH